MTKPNTESSSSALMVQSSSLSASQDAAVKPGEYPFKRGESDRGRLLLICSYFHYFYSYFYLLFIFMLYLPLTLTLVYNLVPVLKTPSPSLKRSVSFPQSAGKTSSGLLKQIKEACEFSLVMPTHYLLPPPLFFSFFLYRKITSLQINHKIWLLT